MPTTIILLNVALFLSACGDKQTTAWKLDGERGCDLYLRDGCQGQCPKNAPNVNVFPINGLDASKQGRCNGEGVAIEKSVLTGGDCGTNAKLTINEGRLIGIRKGAEPCTGQALVGASFTLRSYSSTAKEKTVRVKISSVKMFTVDHDLHGPREGYELRAIDKAGNVGDPLCKVAAAQDVRKLLGLKPIAQVAFGESDDAPGNLAIVVGGPVYDHINNAIPGTKAGWFNLACATDALAKAAMFDLVDASDIGKSRAALDMITANYCGKPYTIKGQPLYFEDGEVGKVESMWGQKKKTGIGARCLSEPRLAHANIDGFPQSLPDLLQPEGCEQHNCDAAKWTAALRAECSKLGPCEALKPADPYFTTHVPPPDAIRLPGAKISIKLRKH